MRKLYILIFSHLLANTAFSQASFVIKVYDFAWITNEETSKYDYVMLSLVLEVINEGNQADVCHELENIYLDCSNNKYSYGQDIIITGKKDFDKVIYSGDTSMIAISFLVPVDADDLKLKFSNLPEAGYKYITESYNKWKLANKDKVSYYEKQAIEYFNKKDYLKSVICCYNALALNPKARVNFTLGNCFISVEDFDAAIEYYNKSYNEVERYYIYDNLGYAYLNKEEYQTALNYFQGAINEKSKEFDPLLGMAITYYCLNNYSKAKEYYKLAEKVESNLKNGMDGLVYLMDTEGVFYGEKELKTLNKICKMMGYNYFYDY